MHYIANCTFQDTDVTVYDLVRTHDGASFEVVYDGRYDDFVVVDKLSGEMTILSGDLTDALDEWFSNNAFEPGPNDMHL